MADGEADFTLTFRRLSDLEGSESDADHAVAAQFKEPSACTEWVARWRQRLAAESSDNETRQSSMRKVNPLYIPRNHLVEEAIQAGLVGDYGPFNELVGVLSRPFEAQPDRDRYASPPRPEQVVQATFCGT